MKKTFWGSALGFIAALTIVIACGDDAATTTTGTCALTANTTETSTLNTYNCAVLTRDTSSCQAERTAQGLSGFWLNFSCRVTLTVNGGNVVMTSDGQPDYKSNYFATTNPCYESFSAAGRMQNPNTLGEQSFSINIPSTPNTTQSVMGGGTVGLAVNGVAIFDNEAAPGDNIYDEVATFDKCEGHPAGTTYHYHIEPPAASNNDSRFVGVMRDGYPAYGSKDANDTTPTLDADGGHTGPTPDSGGASVYHYHVNLQTDGTDSALFITKGTYHGSPGSCGSGCN